MKTPAVTLKSPESAIRSVLVHLLAPALLLIASGAAAQEKTFGTVYDEFECGGTGANHGTNTPETPHQWWIDPSYAYGGEPYQEPAIYRTAIDQQGWTYEFDLPDTAAAATLRLRVDQYPIILASGSQGVRAEDRAYFNGTVLFAADTASIALMDCPLSLDLTPYLADNPQKKVYVHFQAGGPGTSVNLQHCRIDNGWPAFPCGDLNRRYSDECFLIPGTVLRAEMTTNESCRLIAHAQPQVYELDLPDQVTQASMKIDLSGAYALSCSHYPDRQWTSAAVSQGVTERAEVTISLNPWLDNNPKKKVYLRITNSDATGATDLRCYSVWTGQLTAAELNFFGAE
jgi:hypothetical protein